MNVFSYKKVVDKNKVLKNKKRNLIIAFTGGGIIALIGQGLYDFFLHVVDQNEKTSLTLVLLVVILASAILTGIGIYDKIAQYLGAGSFIPISGFSNALTSSALESKSEGLIYGIGSNIFKLAGSVITYGIVSAYLLGLIKYFVLLIGGMI